MVLEGFLLVFWIAPMAFFAIFDAPPNWVPKEIQRFVNVSRLFSYEQSQWYIYTAEATLSNLKDIEIEEHVLFGRQPYGARSRFQRTLDLIAPEDLPDLGRWLASRLDEIFADETVIRLRFVRYLAKVEDARLGRYDQKRHIELQRVSKNLLCELEIGPADSPWRNDN